MHPETHMSEEEQRLNKDIACLHCLVENDWLFCSSKVLYRVKKSITVDFFEVPKYQVPKYHRWTIVQELGLFYNCHVLFYNYPSSTSVLLFDFSQAPEVPKYQVPSKYQIFVLREIFSFSSFFHHEINEALHCI